MLCLGNITIDDAVLPDGTVRPNCLGGDAIYSGLAARLFQPDTRILAPVGSDLSDEARAALESAGIAVSALPARRAPTVRNVVTYEADGSRTWDLRVPEETFEELSVQPEDLDERALEAVGVLSCAMGLMAQTRTVAYLAAHSDALLYLDLQEDYIVGNEEAVLAMVAVSDVFLPSEEEVRRLLGTEDWAVACRTLVGLGPDVVVVKRAAEGCLVYEAASDRLTEVPAFPTVAVDSTGAGDAFCGGFAAVYGTTDDAVAAAKAGAVAASYAIAGFGNDVLLTLAPAEARARLTDWTAASG